MEVDIKNELSKNSNLNLSISLSDNENKVNSSDANILRHKRKRRSKNDPHGRNFTCHCGKAYLSTLALSNHKKNKHDTRERDYSQDSLTETKKRRGRPKKDDKKENRRFSNFKSFFEDDQRKRSEREKEKQISEYVSQVFCEIFIIFKDKCNYEMKKEEHHPLLKLIKERPEIESENLTCDKIFLEYLKEVRKNTNNQYFFFVFKFVVLFRECINKYKNVELENSKDVFNEAIPESVKDFTEFYDAEQVPELCNEFITDYLSTNDFFGMKREAVDEFIEIIQHFSFWLYDRNYTSSRLATVREI